MNERDDYRLEDALRHVAFLEAVIDYIEPALGPASDDIIAMARQEAEEELGYAPAD